MATLFDTGINKSYDKSELSKLFNTKESFLTSNDIPVMKREFNWIPNGKQDPPRALTDPAKATTHYYENHAVVSDFPKSLVGETVAKMWKDGTYDDMEKQADKDREELYNKITFAPDRDFNLRFSRLDREQNAQAIMTNYFAQVAQEKDAERRIYLTEYGLSPSEVEDVLARQRIENAYEGLKSSKRHYSQAEQTKKIELAVHKAVEQRAAERKAAGIPEITQPLPRKAEETHAQPTPRAKNIKPKLTGDEVLAKINNLEDINTLSAPELAVLVKQKFGGKFAAGKAPKKTELVLMAREGFLAKNEGL